MKSFAICAVPAGMAIAMLAIPDASAQQKCKLSWEASVSDSKYTQQLTLDAGDIPGHQVGVYEIHRVFPNFKPNCEGQKFTESWSRGYRDYINRNGHTWGYTVYTLENGDKIYTEFTGSVQTRVGAEGSKRTSAEATAKWTGGTGKYQGIRGFEWDLSVFDPDKGVNQIKSEAEYWFEK
jgi:hypothetical protein